MNGDVDRNYLKRKQGGGGLIPIQNAFECRIASFSATSFNHQLSKSIL